MRASIIVLFILQVLLHPLSSSGLPYFSPNSESGKAVLLTNGQIDTTKVTFTLVDAFDDGDSIAFIYEYHNNSRDTIAVYKPKEQDCVSCTFRPNIFYYENDVRLNDDGGTMMTSFYKKPYLNVAYNPICSFEMSDFTIFADDRIEYLASDATVKCIYSMPKSILFGDDFNCKVAVNFEFNFQNPVASCANKVFAPKHIESNAITIYLLNGVFVCIPCDDNPKHSSIDNK